MPSFDPERYTRRGQQQRQGGQPQRYPQGGMADTETSRQRIIDLMAKRDKNATSEAQEYYSAKNQAKRDLRRRQAESDRGWGKLGMLGTAVGSMFGAPWLGAAVGSGLGLAKAASNRGKYGGNFVGNLGKSLFDVGGGLINPILENPMLAAGAAMGAAPYVMGDKVSLLGELFGGGAEFGSLGGAGGYLPELAMDPGLSADMGFNLYQPSTFSGAYSPGSLSIY